MSQLNQVSTVITTIFFYVGGHSNSGYSTINGTLNNGFVIHLAKLDAIAVSSDRVEVQAGVRWVDIYELLNRIDSQQLIVGGMCPLVGVAGYTLGGGYSVLSRQYGLASDNVVSMRMVTANGTEIVFINETVNSDLYWALRGGGGGNFGIVTKFTFRTHTASYQNYTLIQLSFESGDISREALVAVGLINSKLPQKMYLDILITSNNELSIWPVYFGKYIEAIQYLKPLLDLASSSNFINFTSYYTLVQIMANERGMMIPTSETPLLQRGCILEKLDYTTVDTLLSLDVPDHCKIVFTHLGGAISDVPSDNTSYVNRDGHFDYYSSCIYQTDKEKSSAYSFEDQLYTKLYNGGHCVGCYVNDIDRFLHNWQQMYYGDNYPLLYLIKEKWNPIGVGQFHFIQEIGSNYTGQFLT